MTRWEQIYRGIKPYHFPRIPDFWDKRTRDFIARLRVKRAELIEEQGPLSFAVKRLSGCITAYLDEDRHPSLAPREETYAAEWKAYWADPSTMTDEHLAAKDAFEAMTPAEQEEMGRGSYSSTRTHVDGRTVNEDGETVGRWKEPEGSILDKVKAWAAETHHGADHVRRWQEAANGIEPGTFPDAATMTSAEASEYEMRFMASRWGPTARAIRDREIGFTGGGTVDAELEEALKVINERPDVEVRKYNPETNTLDVLSPATATESAPEHMVWFGRITQGTYPDGRYIAIGTDPDFEQAILYLLMEFEGKPQGFVRQNTPTKGPARVHHTRSWNQVDIKRTEPVKRKLSEIEAEFGTWSWLGGDRPTPKPDAAYKAEQDAQAEEVEIFQAARDAGEPDAQLGFDEWKRREAGTLFPWNGVYVEDVRTGCFIASDQVARRRDELTAVNVRYRLSRHPDGMAQISWLALNYEGCLCLLPHNTETETRMVPAEEVPDLIWAGWRLLTHKEYNKNQRVTGAKDDKFHAFKLWVQYSPAGKPLGVCPTQGDSSDGKWKYNEDLFSRLHGHAVEEVAPVDAPTEIANAILAGDWAEVARLAQERAGS